jgi:hypothetical protein
MDWQAMLISKKSAIGDFKDGWLIKAGPVVFGGFRGIETDN